MILYRYIIREHIFPFLASLSIIVFLFLMQWAAILLDRIISKGLPASVIFEIFIIQLGWIIALAIPMAFLTSTLMTFGRMAGDNEIMAIKASGRSMWPMLIPVFSAAAIFTVLLIYFNDMVLPDANHRAANLLSDISRKRPAALIESGVLIREFPNYTLYTQHVNSTTGELRGIRIFSDAADRDPSITVASQGYIRVTSDDRYYELTLFDGESHSLSRQDPKSYFVARFQKQVVYIENIDTRLQRTNSTYRSDREKSSTMMLQDVKELATSKDALVKEYNASLDSLCRHIALLDSSTKKVRDTLSAKSIHSFAEWAAGLKQAAPRTKFELRRADEYTDRLQRRVRANDMMISQYMVEVHKKFAIPVACLIFVLIGAPLGIMARRGGMAVGATYSIFFFIAYWAFLIGGESMADKMKISPEIAMWSGNVVIGLCGVLLTVLMLRETTIRFDFLVHRWSKLTNWKKKGMERLSNNPVVHLIRLPGVLVKLPSLVLRFIIRIVPSYLIRLFLGYFIGVMCSIVVVFAVVDYISNLKLFEGSSGIAIVVYYLYYMPWIIQTVLPIVLLLASMFAIGRLTKNSELTAMKAAGISIRQLTFPLLVLGAIVAVTSFYAGEWIIPKTNQLRRELSESLGQKGGRLPSPVASREFRRDFYYFGDMNTMYNFEEFSTMPQISRNVTREIFENDRIVQRIQAENMVYDSTGWRFINAEVRTFYTDSSHLQKYTALNDSILKTSPANMVARVKVKEEMSYWELSKYVDLARHRGEQVQKYAAELDFKIALPFINFIVILLGIAITARAGRKGSPVLFGIGLLMTFMYWMITRFTIVFAQNGHLPPLVGAWFGNVLFFLIALLLFRKASR